MSELRKRNPSSTNEDESAPSKPKPQPVAMPNEATVPNFYQKMKTRYALSILVRMLTFYAGSSMALPCFLVLEVLWLVH